jgi:hypothetical protein
MAEELFLQNLCEEVSDMVAGSEARVSGESFSTIVSDFPALFSPTMGSANCAPCEIELSDPTPVLPQTYRCAPPKLGTLKKMVNELLEQGVVRPSRSPYASPAFLVPKNGGGFRLIVDYRKVNAKVIFDSYPMPTIEQAFEQFGGAAVFTVLDLNSAYYQITPSCKSRSVTAFCKPFGLFEFKTTLRISVGCQSLSRVMDELFSDLKGDYVLNFRDDLVVFSPSATEHVGHLRTVLRRLQSAGFTLNPDKDTFGGTEIKYLGHKLLSRGIVILPDRVAAIKSYPRPTNLQALRLLGMVGLYARFIPDFSRRADALRGLKKKGVRFVWGNEHQMAFESLKLALSEAPVLQIPDFNKEFVLVTDSSDLA